ncbi:MAG: hypothetical protein JJE25_14395, partial [Bacteroidia bacterium]|nr:hypothetical protein [Bacteroidia bacterium]
MKKFWKNIFVITFSVTFVLAANYVTQAQTTAIKWFGSSNSEYGISICQTYDGGFILAGQTKSNNNYPINIWLIKTDANGDSLWSR